MLRYYSAMHRELILASASPQRKALLEGLSIPFRMHVSRVQESDVLEHDPVRRACMLSALKAEDVAQLYPHAWIIGCDTLVVSADGTLLEKPEDAAEAREMILCQRGKVSTVHSGLSVHSPDGRTVTDVSSSSVHFKALTDEEVAWWISTNLWKDRSGSFQIDGPGQLMIERIAGDWAGIVGLPVYLLGQLLKKAGWDVFTPQSPS